MSTFVYPELKEALGLELVHLVTDTIRIQAYDSDVVEDDTDVFLADVVGTAVGSPVEVTSRDFTLGQFTGDVGQFFWPGGHTVTALIVYQDTGVAATSRLCAWLGDKADTTPLAIVTAGVLLQLHWNDPIFSIGG